jgi:hypothetical protein
MIGSEIIPVSKTITHYIFINQLTLKMASYFRSVRIDRELNVETITIQHPIGCFGCQFCVPDEPPAEGCSDYQCPYGCPPNAQNCPSTGASILGVRNRDQYERAQNDLLMHRIMTDYEEEKQEEQRRVQDHQFDRQLGNILDDLGYELFSETDTEYSYADYSDSEEENNGLDDNILDRVIDYAEITHALAA